MADGDTMLYVDGSKTAFRCISCGSNVFRLVNDTGVKLVFECNGCGDEYRAERDDVPAEQERLTP